MEAVEIIALAVQALQATGLETAFSVGHVGFIDGLAEEVALMLNKLLA